MHTYRWDDTYERNYDEGPLFADNDLPPPPGGEATFKLWDYSIRSRLGIFSGPLLNRRWVELYSRCGFDVLVYKTVRSRPHPCHPAPNCAFVDVDSLSVHSSERPPHLYPLGHIGRSMTNSFGMPSKHPEIWMDDVAQARARLCDNQILLVSVVGDSVDDYARTAGLARDAGAHAVELNLSCPNVLTSHGSFYRHPPSAATVAMAVKAAVGPLPVVAKVGYIEEESLLSELLEAISPFVGGVSGINTVPMPVLNHDGTPLLGEERRVAGICGQAIKACGLRFTAMVAEWKRRNNASWHVLCGGGIIEASHIEEYLNAGSEVAMVATGAMLNPRLAYDYAKATPARGAAYRDFVAASSSPPPGG